MLNHLNNHFNETTTANGAKAFVSTQSNVLDLFSEGGAMRLRSDEDIVRLFSKAYAEDATLAMKTLFYLRDREQGQGERKFFKLALKHLALHHKESLVKNIHLVPKFGRWDDLWVLLDTKVKDDVVKLVRNQLNQDLNTDNPSLLGKWMPSANTSSHKTRKFANTLQKALGLSPRNYRKVLVGLRKKIDIVETKLTKKEYDSIDYSKIPSKAGMIYRQAFLRNDGNRYEQFLDSLSKGEATINSGMLYPNEIVGKILNSYYGRLDESQIKLFEGQWNNLTNFIGDKVENSLVMADVSESMSGTPMEVSIALAMYIAERNKGLYHNHFMTFTDKPSMVSIQGKDIVEKVRNIKARKGYSTDIQKALQSILDVAVTNNLTNEEVVDKLIIISDMQFDDYSISGTSVNIFKEMERKFNQNGYDFPNVVFWNVNAYGNQPMTMNEQGVILVSGYSPSILKQLLGAKRDETPYHFMLEVITSERYEEIVA